VGSDDLDAARFEALLAEARAQAFAGDHARAANTLRQALALRSRYGDNPPWYLNFSDHQTEIIWANLEIAAGNCADAAGRLREAYRLLSVLPPGPWLEPYRMQADTLQTRVNACQGALPPGLPAFQTAPP
jgi:hypothetical protein